MKSQSIKQVHKNVSPLISFSTEDDLRREGVTQLQPRLPSPNYMIMPTPLTPSVDSKVACNISVDEYFDTVHVDNKALFGNKYNQVINISVAYYYINVLKSPPPYEWKGRYGTIIHICKYLNIPNKKRRIVGLILLEITKCKQQNRFYKGVYPTRLQGGGHLR